MNDISSQEPSVLVDVDNAVMTISMNRPAKKNAINIAMYIAMTKAINTAVNDSNIRVILFTGEQGCLTSGNDLTDFASAEANDLESPDNPITGFMRAFSVCPKPIVVSVDGLAVGIGTTLLLHADLVYANSEATFKLPFVNLGLCPEFAVSYLLPRLSGYVRAAELLLLGESFDASTAKELGLINDIVDNPWQHAKKQCRKLAAQPPSAIRETKALMRGPLRESTQRSTDKEISVFIKTLAGPEFKESVTAFFEKRDPDFSDFS